MHRYLCSNMIEPNDALVDVEARTVVAKFRNVVSEM